MNIKLLIHKLYMQQKIKSIYPAELSEFQCAGCGECCKNWSISIDKQTFKKYSEILKEEINGLPYPFFITDNNHHFFKLYNSVCPFLIDDKYCYIHKNLGSQYKCDTCRIYPRLKTRFGNRIYTSLTFSCAAAATMLLSDKNFSLKDKLENFNIDSVNLEVINLLDNINIHANLYFKIEEKIINFINDDFFIPNIEEKIIILSAWQRKLFEKIKENNRQGVIKIINSDIDNLYNNLEILANQLAEITTPATAQLSFLITVLNNAKLFYKNNLTLAKNDFFGKLKKVFDFFEIDFHGKYRKGLAAVKYRNIIKDNYYPQFNIIQPAIKKYFLFNITGKRFFLEYDLIRGLNMQIVCYSLIRLLTALDAAYDNRAITAADLIENIKFVERNFMHANRIFTFWSGSENETTLNIAPFAKIIVNIQ